VSREPARLKANVLGVDVEATDMAGAMIRIQEALRSRRKGYICFANVHGVMEAQRNPDLAAIYSCALLALPDGMPTAWVGRAQGHKKMRRVAGPDVMLEVFRREEFSNYTHYLCGGKPGVVEDLRSTLSRRFPHARIVGTYTPPFRELSLLEREAFIMSVQEVKPDIVWVGISTPKQERFMNRFLPYLDTKLMFGVGAAFDFHTGRIKDSPNWVKVAGLQWMHRLLQDPRHLWKRHLLNNPAFLYRVAIQLAGRSSYLSPQLEPEGLNVAADARLLRKTGSEV
jgi:N-acetylglucosaminyldiphosphoundecaprenol N-acetyl-beta-D-mannosaminyltransferase